MYSLELIPSVDPFSQMICIKIWYEFDHLGLRVLFNFNQSEVIANFLSHSHRGNVHRFPLLACSAASPRPITRSVFPPRQLTSQHTRRLLEARTDLSRMIVVRIQKRKRVSRWEISLRGVRSHCKGTFDGTMDLWVHD